MAAVILEPKKIKSVSASTFPPSIHHEVMVLAFCDLSFLNVEFQASLFKWVSSSHQVANTSWQIEGGKVEALTDFIFLGSRITEDGDCSHEIKRHLLLGRKAITNPNSIFKSRDITLLTKICLVKAMVFPVAMNGYEWWTIKQAEHQRIDDFKLRC